MYTTLFFTPLIIYVRQTTKQGVCMLILVLVRLFSPYIRASYSKIVSHKILRHKSTSSISFCQWNPHSLAFRIVHVLDNS